MMIVSDNTINKSEYILCGDPVVPQICVKADAEDILKIAKGWHKLINNYPYYASAIGLTEAASPDTIEHIMHRYGTDINSYNKPIILGCSTNSLDKGAVIDANYAHPVSNAGSVFVLENLLEANPKADCEILLIALPGSFYPETLIYMRDQIFKILADNTDPCSLDLYAYEQIYKAADKNKLSIAIEKNLNVYISGEAIDGIKNTKELASMVHLISVCY